MSIPDFTVKIVSVESGWYVEKANAAFMDFWTLSSKKSYNIYIGNDQRQEV
jgi:hypothetical protein